MKNYLIQPLPVRLRRYVALLPLLGGLSSAQANNITVTGMSLTDINTSTHTLNALFNVTWENSWFLNPANAPGNWYIDTRCTDCSAARTVAPGLIVERDGQSVFERDRP